MNTPQNENPRFQAICAEAKANYYRAKGSLRLGQCYYNALPDDLAIEVNGESYDPYDEDTHIEEFLEWLYKRTKS